MAMIMDVSTLSAAELKRLVETMRSRGQDELADQLSDAWSRNRVRINHAGPPGPIVPPAPEPPPMPLPPPRRQLLPAVATVAVAMVAGAALGWGLNLPGVQIALPRAPDLRVADATPPQPAQPRAALALATYAPPTRPVAAPVPAPAAPEPAPAPTATAAATDATATAAEPPRNACYDLPSPGERLACGFPGVAARQRRMQVAYDAAIAAGADPAALGQTAWVQAANKTWDRQALMDKMEARIHEIQAAVPAPATPPSP